MAIINIPSYYQQFTKYKKQVTIKGVELFELLIALTKQYRGLRPYIFSSKGEVNRFLSIYLNRKDRRWESHQFKAIVSDQDLRMPVGDEDMIDLLVSLSETKSYGERYWRHRDLQQH